VYFRIRVDGPQATEEGTTEGFEDDKRWRSFNVGRNYERAVRRRTETNDEHLPEDYSHPATRLRLPKP